MDAGETTYHTVDMLIWRSGQPDAWGDLFTPEALEQLAKTIQPGDPLTLGFDPQQVIGRVVQVWMQGNDMYGTAEIADSGLAQEARDGKLSMRPGFVIRAQHIDSEGVRVIDKAELLQVALMPGPQPLPGDSQRADS